jgi:hypothetical protein
MIIGKLGARSLILVGVRLIGPSAEAIYLITQDSSHSLTPQRLNRLQAINPNSRKASHGCCEP